MQVATRLDQILNEPELAKWLIVLLATNLASLAIDAIDAIRFLRGEHTPHYRWSLAEPQ